MSLWDTIKTLLGKFGKKAVPAVRVSGTELSSKKGNKPTGDVYVEAPAETGCCSDVVHIAFRGIADDRLYLSRERRWQEVRYYRPNGLKVFCARCRRRLI